MPRNAVVTMLLAVSFARAQSVSKIGDSDFRGTYIAFSSGAKVPLRLDRVRLMIRHASGEQQRANMTVVYEPRSGHYYWGVRTAQTDNDTGDLASDLASGTVAFYAAPEALVVFGIPGPTLFILARSEHSDSSEAAETASIREIQEGLPLYEGRGYDPGYKSVELGASIDRAWFCSDLTISSFCPYTGHIVAVERNSRGWRLVARNRWDQDVLLNSRFELIGTSTVRPPMLIEPILPYTFQPLPQGQN